MSNYYLPAYHFKVEWGGTRTSFLEVCGLSIENEVIEYREGDSPDYATIKAPGLRKYSNVTLKRGIIKNDNDFFSWINTIQSNVVEKRDVIISLLDENHQPVRVWKLHNAWPCKISSSDLKQMPMKLRLKPWNLRMKGWRFKPLSFINLLTHPGMLGKHF